MISYLILLLEGGLAGEVILVLLLEGGLAGEVILVVFSLLHGGLTSEVIFHSLVKAWLEKME